jgi:hypothetical protein
MRLLAACAALLLAACQKAPSNAPAGYSSPDGGFHLILPAAWRVDESRGKGMILLSGPGLGSDAESVFVSFFPSQARWRTPREYAYAQAATGRAGPVTETARGVEVAIERTIADAHLGRLVRDVRLVLVPAAGGFYALEDWTDPSRAAPSPDFDALAASFRAGAGPPAKKN